MTAISTSRRGILDVLVSAVPQSIGIFSTVLGAILIARGLGPSGLGEYALVLSLIQAVSTLSDLGIGQTAIRYASRAAANGDFALHSAVLRWALGLRVTLLVVVTAPLYWAAPLLAQRIWDCPQLVDTLRLGLLGGWLVALASVPNLYLQSLRRFRASATVTTLQRLLTFLGILAIAYAGLWSLNNLVTATLIASAVGLVVILRLVPLHAFWPSQGMAFERLDWRSFLLGPRNADANQCDGDCPGTFAGFHFLASILCMLLLNTDVWMMGYFLDKEQIGLYAAGMRMALPITIVLGAINTALWPRVSTQTTKEATHQLFTKVLRLSCLLAGAFLPYALLAPMLSPYLFGVKYCGSVVIGQLLCIRYLFSIVACPAAVVGYNLNLVRVYPIIHVMQFAVVFIGNLLLLPSWGPIASCLALILVEVVTLAVICPMIYVRLTRKGGA